MTIYKKCKKCGNDFPFEGSFRKSKKIRYLCIDCINKLLVEDDDNNDNLTKQKSNPTAKHSSDGIDWNDPKVIIIAILVIIFVFAFFISIKRDYFPNNYPEPRPMDAIY